MGEHWLQDDAVQIPHAHVGRGARFGKRLLSPLSVIVSLALIAFCVYMAIDTGAVDSAATVLVIGFAIILRRAWKKATKDARDAFFFAYADARGLVDPGSSEILPATPLLRAGDRRQYGRLMWGMLQREVYGLIGHYVFEEVAGKAENERVIFNEFTVVLMEVPEVGNRLSEFYCEVRSGLDNDRSLNYPLPGVEGFSLESSALMKRYDMRSVVGEDEILLRRVFAPSFIVWLAEQPPERFGFELSGGMLCCYVHGLLDSAEDLDELADVATTIGTRLNQEVRDLTLR